MEYVRFYVRFLFCFWKILYETCQYELSSKHSSQKMRCLGRCFGSTRAERNHRRNVRSIQYMQYVQYLGNYFWFQNYVDKISG